MREVADPARENAGEETGVVVAEKTGNKLGKKAAREAQQLKETQDTRWKRRCHIPRLVNACILEKEAFLNRNTMLSRQEKDKRSAEYVSLPSIL